MMVRYEKFYFGVFSAHTYMGHSNPGQFVRDQYIGGIYPVIADTVGTRRMLAAKERFFANSPESSGCSRLQQGFRSLWSCRTVCWQQRSCFYGDYEDFHICCRPKTQTEMFAPPRRALSLWFGLVFLSDASGHFCKYSLLTCDSIRSAINLTLLGGCFPPRVLAQNAHQTLRESMFKSSNETDRAYCLQYPNRSSLLLLLMHSIHCSFTTVRLLASIVLASR